ncbi:MAG: hypothetical protein F6J87_27490 [Spirulina sp. SIO3F2]|nr:hypothetical protein [Spirulina sp. SIO3F2]
MTLILSQAPTIHRPSKTRLILKFPPEQPIKLERFQVFGWFLQFGLVGGFQFILLRNALQTLWADGIVGLTIFYFWAWGLSSILLFVIVWSILAIFLEIIQAHLRAVRLIFDQRRQIFQVRSESNSEYPFQHLAVFEQQHQDDFRPWLCIQNQAGLDSSIVNASNTEALLLSKDLEAKQFIVCLRDLERSQRTQLLDSIRIYAPSVML